MKVGDKKQQQTNKILETDTEDVLLVGFMYRVFTRGMPDESHRSQLGSLLLCLCDVFRALINSLAHLFVETIR